jgi:diguanylate cyclase (GGDEF)-like protein/PAS domain S-box-containing protein
LPWGGDDSLRVLLDAAPVPLTLTRAADSVVIYGNRRTAALFEVPPADIPGQRASEFWVDGGERDTFLSALMSNGHVDGHEVRMKTNKGRVFWARISAQTVQFGGELCMLGGIVDVSDARALEERLRALAVTDPLTGAFNRRHFSELGDAELRRAARYGHPTSLAMLDVDHFKAVNDEGGHPAGDAVLRTVADALVRRTKASDLVARLGGDEFAVVLPDCSARDAVRVAERVRSAFVVAASPASVTLSAGIATIPDHATVAEELLAAADAALYAAKRAGRDRTEVATPGTDYAGTGA